MENIDTKSIEGDGVIKIGTILIREFPVIGILL
jgi:hypothetical protein